MALNPYIMNTPTRLLACLVIRFFGCSLSANAQQHFTVRFNEQGAISDSLPAVLTSKDHLHFELIGTHADREKRETEAFQRYMDIIKNLDEKDEKDKTVYKVLKDAGLGYDTEAITNLKTVQALLADRLLAYLGDREHYKAIKRYRRTINDDMRNLEVFKKLQVNTKLNLLIPTLDDLAGRHFVVRYGFEKGLKSLSDYPCPNSIELSEKKTNCCTFAWLPEKEADLNPYQFRGVYRDTFKLVLHNNNLLVYNEQIKALENNKRIMSDPHNGSFSKSLDGIFDALGKKDKDYAKVIDWMNKNLKHTADDKLTKEVNEISDTKLKSMENDLIVLIIKNKPTDDQIIAKEFLFQLVWLSDGKKLSANPLAAEPKPDNKKNLTVLDKRIDSLKNLDSLLVGRMGLVQNISKAGNTSCCTIGYVDDIVKKYEVMQKEKVNLDTLITQAKKKKDDLNSQQISYVKNNSNITQNYFKDSLLYSGAFIVNPFQDYWSAPNRPGYHYVRNHNSLDDAHHFDIKIQKSINELQHMDILAINSGRNSKYALTSNFTDLATTDFFSQQITAAASKAGAGQEVLNASLKLIYSQYEQMYTYLSLFKNSPIDTELLEEEDTTANFVTRRISHSGSETSNKNVAYQITDQVSKKNINSETTIFSYNYDKLSRFSFKAGIAYSWLSRRTYTINQTANTATYTDSYAGLAPVIGFQVYMEKIDMLSQRFMPVSWHPFLYVGYMFHDTPANNFLFGGGVELISGISFLGGVHLGKSQGLTLQQGNLVEKDYYKVAPFISISVGIEAFKTIFSSSTITNPLK